MGKLYAIRNWNDNFEMAQSRKVEGPLNWVALPTKHDGLGFRRIMSMPNGLSIYGAWVLIVQVAAKCTPRGVLADETGPFTADDLAAKTGSTSESFAVALKVLSSNKIGWIMVSEWESDGSWVPTQDSTRQDITLQIAARAASAELSPKAKPAAVSVPRAACSEYVFPTTGKGASEWTLPMPKLNEYLEAYPALDVHEQLRKARQWCRDNPRHRKTAGGMLTFLTRWLNRAQDNNRGGAVLPVPKVPRKNLSEVAMAALQTEPCEK